MHTLAQAPARAKVCAGARCDACSYAPFVTSKLAIAKYRDIRSPIHSSVFATVSAWLCTVLHSPHSSLGTTCVCFFGASPNAPNSCIVLRRHVSSLTPSLYRHRST